MLLDIHTLTSIADYLVICSGGSERQLGGIAGGIIEVLKDEGVQPYRPRGWTLRALGAHRLRLGRRPRHGHPERDFYQLEKLWSDAPLLLHVQ